MSAKSARENGMMHSLTVEIHIPDELQERFKARVREHGGDEGEYLSGLLERALRAEAPHAGMTFDELLSLASGPSPADTMTDGELAEFAEAEVKTYRAEKRAGAKRA
jgi:hypothetical protein